MPRATDTSIVAPLLRPFGRVWLLVERAVERGLSPRAGQDEIDRRVMGLVEESRAIRGLARSVDAVCRAWPGSLLAGLVARAWQPVAAAHPAERVHACGLTIAIAMGSHVAWLAMGPRQMDPLIWVFPASALALALLLVLTSRAIGRFLDARR